MNLDKLKIEARTRTPWEAVDLGFLLARSNYRVLYFCWAIPAGILFIFLSILLPEQLWLTPFIIWWLKPFLDRLPLYVISRDVFGENVSLGVVYKNIWSIFKIDLVHWLTYRRFSPTRSMDMPVNLLEQLTSSRRSKRLSVLHRKGSNAAVWLSVIGLSIEWIFFLAIYSFAFLMVPDEYAFDYFEGFEVGHTLTHLFNFTLVLAMTITAPFYVASGFTLYISRRIDLEAWDVEIRFRHLVNKRQGRSAFHASILFVLMTFCMFGMLAPSKTHAVEDDRETSTLNTEIEASKELIEKVLNGDEFHRTKKIGSWQPKNKKDGSMEEITPEQFIKLIQFFERLFEYKDFFALIVLLMNILLWGSAIVLVGIAIYFLVKRYSHFSKPTLTVSSQKSTPDVLFGLEVTKESLPEDVAGETLKLWESGCFRQSLALLYRATLSYMMHSKHVVFEESFTEGECIKAAMKQGRTTHSEYLTDVTLSWQQVAYGHIRIQDEIVFQLCARWKGAFIHEN